MGADGWESGAQTPGAKDGRARGEGVILRPGLVLMGKVLSYLRAQSGDEGRNLTALTCKTLRGPGASLSGPRLPHPENRGPTMLADLPVPPMQNFSPEFISWSLRPLRP